MIQIITLSPAYKALSKVPNNKDTWELYPYKDTEDLKANILQNPDFIKNWATIAHFLGFASCGGTGSAITGEDFSFERIFEKDDNDVDHEVYYLKGNYNSKDPYAKGYCVDERLQMKISNVRLIIDRKTLKGGKFRIIDTEPIMIASVVLENTSDKDNDANISFTYASNKRVSISNDPKVNEKICVKEDFKIYIPFDKNKESTLNVKFSTEQGWEKLDETALTEINTIEYYDKVQTKSKRQVDLISTLKRLERPYEGRIYIEYDITFTGFLRESGNAHVDHPIHRPKKSITFGGRNGMSATEDLLDIYSNRHRKGYSQWDWQWIIANFGKKNMNSFIKEFCTVKRGGEIKGVYNLFEGTQIEFKASDEETIDTIIKDESSSKENKVELKTFKTFNTPIFDIKSLTINR